jgi:hypothetical protein
MTSVALQNTYFVDVATLRQNADKCAKWRFIKSAMKEQIKCYCIY